MRAYYAKHGAEVVARLLIAQYLLTSHLDFVQPANLRSKANHYRLASTPHAYWKRHSAQRPKNDGLVSYLKNHRFQEKGRKESLDPEAMAAAAMAAASGAPTLPFPALPKGIAPGSLGWGMVPPLLPPIPAIPAPFKPRKMEQYLAGGFDPTITPGIAKRLSAGEVRDVKGQQQKELDASNQNSLSKVLGVEEKNTETADAFAKSGGVAPHGVLSDWAVGGVSEISDVRDTAHKGTNVGSERSDGNPQDSGEIDGQSVKAKKNPSADSPTTSRASPNKTPNIGNGTSLANEEGNSSMSGSAKSSDPSKVQKADSRRKIGSNAKARSQQITETKQDDRVPNEDSTGILSATIGDVNKHLLKHGIFAPRDNLAYEAGLPKLGDLPDDPYPPLNKLMLDKVPLSHNYGNRIDGKFYFDTQTGYWIKGTSQSHESANNDFQADKGISRKDDCLVTISACSKPPSSLSDLEAGVCTGRFRNSTALARRNYTSPRRLTAKNIASECLIFRKDILHKKI